MPGICGGIEVRIHNLGTYGGVEGPPHIFSTTWYLSALLQLHLHSRLNLWFQWIGQRQLQDETRNIISFIGGISLWYLSNKDFVFVFGMILNIGQEVWGAAGLVCLYFQNTSMGPWRAPVKSMMTSSNGNIFRVTGHLCGEFTGPGEFPAQRPVTRSFDVFFDLRLNKRLSKQSWGWWFETLSPPLWRHRHGQANITNSKLHLSLWSNPTQTRTTNQYWKNIQLPTTDLAYQKRTNQKAFSLDNLVFHSII